MAETKLADVIVPEVWNDYFLEKTAETSVLLNSGILSADEAIRNKVNGGGNFVEMPFWTDLTGDDEAGGKGFDGDPLTMDKINAEKDVAVKIFRAKMWGATDFADILSGDDPLGRIADRAVAYWNRRKQVALISALKGVFNGALSSTHVLDISGETGAAAVIGASSTIDAGQKLGDVAGELKSIAMHSATYAKLQKDQLIEYVEPANAKIRIPTYLGKTVVVDDTMPVESDVYTTYLFAGGAIGYADIDLGKTAVETDRDTSSGLDTLVTRVGFVMHPRGVKWAVTTANPDNTALATGGNWERVYELKNIRMIAFKHKLA